MQPRLYTRQLDPFQVPGPKPILRARELGVLLGDGRRVNRCDGNLRQLGEQGPGRQLGDSEVNTTAQRCTTTSVEDPNQGSQRTPCQPGGRGGSVNSKISRPSMGERFTQPPLLNSPQLSCQ